MSPPSRRARTAAALAVGVTAALFTRYKMATMQAMAGVELHGFDFTYWWRAARAVLQGRDPYSTVVPEAAFHVFDGRFVYPLPAALATVPFAPFPAAIGAALFVGVGFALAAYALSASGWWRLLILASLPAMGVLEFGQWSALLLAAGLLPWLGFLLACKPTIGVAYFAARPTWRTLVGGILFVALAFAVQPGWVGAWLATIRAFDSAGQYSPPLLAPGGFLLLAVLLRWRRPEARLLAVLAAAPQNYIFYDQLALFLIPRGRWQIVGAVFWSHAVHFAARRAIVPWPNDDVVAQSASLEPWIVWGWYLPAALLVLSRRNEGDLPAWLDRIVVRAPAWLRGRPASVAAAGAAAPTCGPRVRAASSEPPLGA